LINTRVLELILHRHWGQLYKVIFKSWQYTFLKTCWWDCKLAQPVWKAVWRLLKKLKIDLPYHPTITLLGVYLKECKSAYKRSTCTFVFISAPFTIAKLWDQQRCLTTNEWMKKNYTHTHTHTHTHAHTPWNTTQT
jgi:hypothetical protein